MDTKLKNEDSNEDNKKGKFKKFNLKFYALALVVLSLFVLVISGFSNVLYFADYSVTDKIRFNTQDQMLRYAKNLNRFYIYYKDFESLTDEEKVSPIDIDEKNNEYQLQILKELSVLSDDLAKKMKMYNLILKVKAEAYPEDFKNLKKYNASTYETNDSIGTTVSNTEDGYTVESEREGEQVSIRIYAPDTHESIFNMTYANYETYLEEMSKSLDEYGIQVNEEYSKYTSKRQALQGVYTLSEADTRKKIIEEKTKNYNDIKSYLKSDNGFLHYIINQDTGQEYTNIENENLLTAARSLTLLNNSKEVYLATPLTDASLSSVFNGFPMNESFGNNSLAGYIIVPKTLSANNDIYYTIYQTVKDQNLAKEYLLFTVIFLAMFLVLSYYLYTKKKEQTLENLKSTFNLFNKLPMTVKLIAFVIFIVLTIAVLSDTPFFIGYMSVSGEYIFGMVGFAILSFFGLLSCAYVVLTVKNFKNLKSEFEVKIFKGFIKMLKKNIKEKNILMPYLLLFSLLGAVISVFLFFGFAGQYYDFGEALFAFIAFGALGITFLYIFRVIHSYSKISRCINEMSEGNLDKVPKAKGKFSKAINQLNDINDGFKKTLSEKLKSERLKTELITNVSHDLKTPLTAIINYIELLQKEEISNEKIVEYVEVLDKKSERLKILIEDLFEAAKLTSGNVELYKTNINIIDLLNQSMGELNEKIQESGIQFKISKPTNEILILLDGKKIWRVFDNLLNNIIKYSTKDSRAYIDIMETEVKVIIIFKNMSAYELSGDASELFERFKRGDDARHTEGSGLGLSIARSIVELHGGEMEIIVDGDLFKVVITLLK